ncbi:hypothetical protein SCHPADRAFT_890398 [Schizopora paradoxa]|uniref:Uncharacterized protein n=1 Tax=Schizopora paradoxa TaxID=27342 RepID=A0A0H2RMB5_9AGAM|nr:hypothetical protein SCHPADRAFT_890398 [Schizopora paradoxa]
MSRCGEERMPGRTAQPDPILRVKIEIVGTLTKGYRVWDHPEVGTKTVATNEGKRFSEMRPEEELCCDRPRTSDNGTNISVPLSDVAKTAASYGRETRSSREFRGCYEPVDGREQDDGSRWMKMEGGDDEITTETNPMLVDVVRKGQPNGQSTIVESDDAYIVVASPQRLRTPSDGNRRFERLSTLFSIMLPYRSLPKGLSFKKRPPPSSNSPTQDTPPTQDAPLPPISGDPSPSVWAPPPPPAWGGNLAGEAPLPGWEVSEFVGGTHSDAPWDSNEIVLDPALDVGTTTNATASEKGKERAVDTPDDGRRDELLVESLMQKLLEYEKSYFTQKLEAEGASKQVRNEQAKRRLDFMRNENLSTKVHVFLWEPKGNPPTWKRRYLVPPERRRSLEHAEHYETILNEFKNEVELIPGLFDGHPRPRRFINLTGKVYNNGYDYHDKYFRPYLRHPAWRAANAASDDPYPQTPPHPNSPPPHARTPSPFGSDSESSGSVTPPRLHPSMWPKRMGLPLYDYTPISRASSPLPLPPLPPLPTLPIDERPASSHPNLRPRSRSPYRRGATIPAPQQAGPSRHNAQRNPGLHSSGRRIDSRSRSRSPRGRRFERHARSPSRDRAIPSRSRSRQPRSDRGWRTRSPSRDRRIPSRARSRQPRSDRRWHTRSPSRDRRIPSRSRSRQPRSDRRWHTRSPSRSRSRKPCTPPRSLAHRLASPDPPASNDASFAQSGGQPMDVDLHLHPRPSSPLTPLSDTSGELPDAFQQPEDEVSKNEAPNAPNFTPPNEDVEMGNENNGFPSPAPTPPPPAPTPPPPAPTPPPFAPTPPPPAPIPPPTPPPELALPQFDPFTEHLYFRFGFTHPEEGPAYPDLESWDGELSDADFLSLAVKFHYSESDFGGAGLRRALYHFAQFFLEKPQNLRCLIREDAAVNVVRVNEVVNTVGSLYRLRSGPQQDEEWSLLVVDASIAVECMRRQLFTTHDILNFFLRRGTPFAIGYDGVVMDVPVDSTTLPSVPWGFEPNFAYFESWETAARDFLISERGHLVWGLGGIYWRMGLYLLGTVPGAQEIVGQRLGTAKRVLATTLFQETLSEAEIAIFIGMVESRDENTPKAPPTRVSYFPHPNAAKGTPLLSSGWTPSNEEWFLTHLDRVRQGRVGFQSQNQWRKLLRGPTVGHPSHRRLEGYNRTRARMWLEG